MTLLEFLMKYTILNEATSLEVQNCCAPCANPVSEFFSSFVFIKRYWNFFRCQQDSNSFHWSRYKAQVLRS